MKSQKSVYVKANNRKHLYDVCCQVDEYGRNLATGHYGCACALIPTYGDVACSCIESSSYAYSHGGEVFTAAVDRAKLIAG